MERRAGTMFVQGTEDKSLFLSALLRGYLDRGVTLRGMLATFAVSTTSPAIRT